MRFQDDGGTRAYRNNLATYRRRGPTFGQWLILIVFFGYCLPFLLLFGVPTLGALWTYLTR